MGRNIIHIFSVSLLIVNKSDCTNNVKDSVTPNCYFVSIAERVVSKTIGQT